MAFATRTLIDTGKASTGSGKVVILCNGTYNTFGGGSGSGY